MYELTMTLPLVLIAVREASAAVLIDPLAMELLATELLPRLPILLTERSSDSADLPGALMGAFFRALKPPQDLLKMVNPSPFLGGAIF
jgi:hypothetical protein